MIANNRLSRLTKSARFLYIFTLLIPLLFFSIPSHADLNDGLVAYYPFNSNANDESTNTNNGTVNGATLTPDRFGNTDSAYYFNGLNSDITIPNHSSINITNTRTISLWMNKFGTAYEGNNYSVISKYRSDTPGESGLSFTAYQNTLDKTYALANYKDGLGGGAATGYGPMAFNEWYFILMVLDTENNQIRLYVNGSEVSVSNSTINLIDNQLNILIGASYGSSGAISGQSRFYGVIDDIRIYDRVLTESEILELYNENDQDHDLIPDDQDNCPTFYNPDQLDSDTDNIGDVCDPDYTALLIHSDNTDGATEFIDSSNSHHIITTNGDVHHEADQAKFGDSSIYFDGDGDYLEIPYSEDWGFGNEDFTIDLWFQGVESSNNYYFCINLITEVDYNRWAFGATSTYIIFHADIDGIAPWDIFIQVDKVFTPNEWYHAAISREGDTWRIFINGELISTTVQAGAIITDSNGVLRIGQNVLNDFYTGYLDEIRISKGIARWTQNFTPPSQSYEPNQKHITAKIDHTKIDEDLADFPVLVHLSADSGIGNFDASDLFAELPSYDDRKKIAIFDPNGNQCYAEIESWDVTNQEAWLWVRVPQVSSTEDTELKILYDKDMADQDQWSISEASDDFTGVDGELPDPKLWKANSTNDQATIKSNKLNFLNTTSSKSVLSTYKIMGDFDIQIDWDISAGPSTNQWWFDFIVTDDATSGNDIFYIERSYTGGQRLSMGKYESGSCTLINSIDNTAVSGKWRIERVGDVFTGYYWSESVWVEFGSSTVSTLSGDSCEILLAAYSTMGTTSDINFDNLKVNKADKIIGGYVGDTGETPAQNVWDDNYAGVWHMAQDPSNGTNSILDSTSNLHHGTPAGGMDGSNLVDSIAGKAINFDGTSNYISLDSWYSLTNFSSGTVEALFNTDTTYTSGGHYLLCANDGTNTRTYMAIFAENIGGSVGSIGQSGDAISSSTDYYNALNWNGSTFSAYLNNSIFIDNLGYSVGTSDGTKLLKLGSYSNPAGQYFQGRVSEIRISQSERSETWLKATYHSNLDDLITYSSTFDTTVDTDAPEPVTNLQVDCTQTSQTSLTFTWDHSENTAGDLSNYIVYFNGDTTGVTIPATQNFYTVSDLSPAASYEISITAIDGETPPNESESTSIAGITLLNNPANLSAIPDYGSVHLSWDAVGPSELVQGYNVYYQEDDDFPSIDNMTPIPVTETSTTINNLEQDKTYYFAVTTTNQSNCENQTVDTVSIVTPTYTTISSNTTITSTNTTYDDETLIVNGCTLTINGSHQFANLILRNGAIVKHSSNSTEQNYILDIKITENLTIETGSEINVNGLGFITDEGPGKGGLTTERFSRGGGGAGHGGYGGSGYGAGGGLPYDLFENPSEIGSGGGGYYYPYYANLTGGNGGGGIKLTVNGILTNDGVITANGNIGKGAFSFTSGLSYSSGGGSGGFILLNVGELSGNGMITANGGNAGDANVGGGGAGGRIAVNYYSVPPSVSYNPANITVDGGDGRSDGEIGTIYIPEFNNPLITTNNGKNFTTNTASITLEGTCVADTDLILINGSSDDVNYSSGATTWSCPVTLSEGLNTFQVMAQDASGNQSGNSEIQIILDTTPEGAPKITTNSGGDYSVQEFMVTFDGTCSADSVEILVNGSSDGVTYTAGDTTWSYEGELEIGDNLFQVTAIDQDSNESPADTIMITFDNTLPDLPTNLTPENGASDVELQPVLTSSTFSDPDAGDTHQSSQWQIRTAAGDYTTPVYDSGEDATNLTQITIPEDIIDWATTYYWHVRYRDSRGSWTDYSNETYFTSRSDVEAPQLVSTAPVNGTELFEVAQIIVTLSDEDEIVIDSVTNSFTVINGDAQTITGSLVEADDVFTFTPDSPLTHGQYTVSFTASDPSGNSQQYDFSFTIDTVPPVVPEITGGTVYSDVIQAAPFENESNTTAVTLTGKREDNTSVWIDGTEQIAIGSDDWSVDLTLSQGDNTLSITLKDQVGNESDPATVLIKVDSIAPVVASITPVTGSYLATAPSSVVVEYTEAVSGIDVNASTLMVRDNSFAIVTGTWEDQGGGQLVFTPETPFGGSQYSQYLVTVQLRDNFGNTGTLIDDHTFTVDTIAPAAPVVNPVETPTHTVTQTITGTREAYIAVFMNNQEIVGHEAGTTWSQEVTLSGGTNTYTFYAKDRAGNQSEDVVVEIVYDDVAPLPVTDLSVNGNGDGTTVQLVWTYNEAEHGDVASYRIFKREGTTAFTDITDSDVEEIPGVNAGLFTCPAEGLTTGTTYYFAVVPVDQMGNYRTDVTSVAGTPTDTQAPDPVSNLTATATEAGTLVFTWSASPSADLAEYRVCFASDACETISGPSPATTYEKTSLDPATAYTFQVFAKDGNDNESTGVSVTGYTYLDNPTGLTPTPYSGKVTLTWNPSTPSEYVKHYAVYYKAVDGFSSVDEATRATTTTGTSVQVAGLTNDTLYYFAVTAVNLSDGENKTVTAISETPVADSQGPDITNLKFGEDTFTSGYVVTQSDYITLNAEDSAGVSRVEFFIDGGTDPVKTDYTGPEYSFYLDALNMTDGSHTLSISAYDTLGNETSETYTFTITMAAPDAPVITQPADGITVNQAEITVTGTAEKNSTITLYHNDAAVQTGTADASGGFSFTLTLVEGQNKIEADAANRGGTGTKSSAVYVTLNTSIPSAPVTITGESKEGGLIRLTWTTSEGSDISGYNLYRASQSFSTIAEAEKLNTDLLTGTQYDDLPSTEGTWYYRVTAENSASNESDLSEEAAVDSDTSGPRAVIAYTPQGNVDPVTGAVAPGRVDILLTVNESLQADPFLTITPEAGVPMSVELTMQSNLTYAGYITITESTPTATAWAVFSARDTAGNRGTAIDSGQSLLIDTDGPAVNRLVIQPLSPVKNDQVSPVTIQVTLGLSEKTKADSTISLGYLLPSQGTEPIAIDDVEMVETQSGDVETWQAELVLPSDAGSEGPETLSFTFSAQDSLENTGTDITATNQFQVYQGDLPPLDAPAGLTGQALPGGEIELTWEPVDDAVGYQLYRTDKDDTILNAYERIDQGETYTDVVTEDGSYIYAVTSIRSENQEESESGQSNSVTVTSDATAPGSPTGLVLDLISQGIRAQWTAPAGGEDVTYRFYKAPDPDTVPENATLIEQGFSQTSWIDFSPSSDKHYYMVTAVDEVGNESLPSDRAYLDFALLPLSSITIVQEDFTLPVITWTHPEAGGIDGYNIYLGDQADGVMLNSTLLTTQTFTDIGYAGDTRTYTLVAVNDGNDSLARSLTLPELTASLDESVTLKRGLMNRLEFTVTNNSSVSVSSITLKVDINGYDHTSETFSLGAGETAIVPVVVGGYDDLPDVADMVTTIEVKPNTSETVQIIRSSYIEVDEGMLVLQISNEEFTKGATGKVGFSLENTGEEEIEITIARNSGNSPSDDVIFYLLDEDDNVLSTANFKQTNDEYAVGLSNGNTVARIPAGGVFTSDLITMNVPSNAPSKVIVELAIGSIYYHQGKTDQVTMDGLETTHDISLVETSYYGTVTDITPAVSSGNEDITITGQAIERATGDPLASVPLNLVVTVKGFERTYTVYTDDDGTFTYDFTPLSGEAGSYTVRAMHPDLRDKPVHGSFVIERISVSPATVNMNIARNYEQTVNVNVKTSEGTTLSNVHLVYDEIDQPQGVFPDGVTLTVGEAKDIGSGGSVNLPFTVWADNTADSTATMVLRVVSGDAEETEHATVTINAGFYNNKPVLYFTPNNIVTGMALDETVTETITLKNNGLADLNDVTLSLYTDDGSDTPTEAPSWVYLSNTTGDLDTIGVGESHDVIIAFSPKEGEQSEDIYAFFLRVESSNYATTDIYMSATVTQSGTGSVLFKLSDIYTGTLDENDQPIQGLSNAKIRLQKEGLTTISDTATSDSYGEALFSDLSVGQYMYRITASNHEEQTGRFWIKPGITVNEEVFLDYNLVTVEWEVTEITIEDTYEITLNTTFETDVPAAVVVAEPASVVLPEMKAGDVYNGEFTLTNYGLIRADELVITMPSSDANFKYEILGGIPESIAAKASIIIPYRVTCLLSLDQEDDGTGGGCIGYSRCTKIDAGYECKNGQWTKVTANHCMTRTYGDCGVSDGNDENSGPPTLPTCVNCETTVGVGSSGGGDGSTSIKPSPPTEALEGVDCPPCPEDPDCPHKGDMPDASDQDVGCEVDTFTRQFTDEEIDLTVKVPGGTVSVQREFDGNDWGSDEQRDTLAYEDTILYSVPKKPPPPWCPYAKKAKPMTGTVAGFDEWPKTFQTTDFDTITMNEDGTSRRDSLDNEWVKYNEEGLVESFGNLQGTVGKLLYEINGDLAKLTGVTDRNDNQVIWYEYNADNKISAAYDSADRRVEYYYTDGKLTRVVDVLGNETFYEYDENGHMTRKVDAEGRETIAAYNEVGDVISVVDSQGIGQFFEYDSDQLKYEYYAQIKYSSGMVKEVLYDENGDTKEVKINGNIVQEIEKQDRYTSVKDDKGKVTYKEYDEWSNLKKAIRPDGSEVSFDYDLRFNKISRVTDPMGVVTEFEYDDSGNMLKKTEAAGTDVERVTTYTYDDDNQLTAIIIQGIDGDDRNPEIINQFTYDDAGNLASIIDPEGGVTQFTDYDIMGNLLRMIDPGNNEWTFTYDNMGRMTSQTDPLTNTTSYEYDNANNRTAIINAMLKRFEFEYDEHNNLIKAKDPYDKYIATEYNTDNLPVGITDQEGRMSESVYDNRGRLTKTIDGAGNETLYYYDESLDSDVSSYLPVRIEYPTYTSMFEYDQLDRRIQRVDDLGDGTTHTTQAEYDASGNLLSGTDEEGKTVRYEYDALDRLVKTIDPMGNEIKYTYDNRGNLIQLQDPNNGITFYEYDKNNRLVKTIKPMLQETTYEYDASGNRTAVIDTKEQKIAYDYNAVNLLTQVRYYAAGDHVNPIKTVDFTYDELGSIKTYNDGTTSATYTYNDLAQKTSETINYGPFSLTFSYTYYADGTKKSFTGPDGTIINYSYDENNRLAGIAIPGQGQITYQYDPAHWNSTAKKMLPGGSTTDYTYDPLMQLTGINAKDPGQNPVMTRSYTRAPSGSILSKDTEHGQYTYQYDDLYRLTQAGNPILPDEAYTYDALGNRLTSAATTTPWSYNANNELQEFDDTAFTYDANGNTTNKTHGTTETRYIYDVEDRMTEVRDSANALIASYYYDPFGRRLWKEVDGIRTYFLYSDEGLVGEYDNTGAELKTYGWIPDALWGTDPLFVKIAGTYYWYRNDHAGTPQKIISTNGSIVWDGKYDAFGNCRVDVAEIQNNLRLAGQYFDAETGLYYNLNRYYDPTTGRYLRTDPYGDGLNLYAYCFADPVNFMDPYGLCATSGVSSAIHNTLAVAGLIPGLGIIPDVLDALFYLFQGDLSGAALAGLAAIPLLGQISRAGQYVKKGLRYLDDLFDIGAKAKKFGSKYADDVLGALCFVAGTLVLTPDGLCSIEEIEPGDFVLSRDEKTGETTWREVVDTFVTPNQKVLELSLEDEDGVTETIGVTVEHPFWVKTKGWVGAKDLLPGDEVFTSSGGWLKVSGSTWLSKRQTVYNFEVEGFHTYFVGESGVWVHNAKSCKVDGAPESIGRNTTPSPALKDSPYSPREVNKRQSKLREKLGLNKDPDTPIPDQSPGENIKDGVHSSDHKPRHDPGQRSQNSNERPQPGRKK